MPQLKLTKNELRDQQYRLGQLENYLPTLQLKKAMLQVEVNRADTELERCKQLHREERNKVEAFQSLLTDPEASILFQSAEVISIVKHYENIAGADLPILEEVVFASCHYALFDSPLWIDEGVKGVRALICAKKRIDIAEEKKKILEKELREVSIRVNLFEKVMIPRILANIKKIKVFLGDQELAFVAQAKVAKTKIEKKKQLLNQRVEM